MKRFDMTFVLAKIPLDFVAAFSAWWLARAIRPYTDLIPYLNIWFDPKFIPKTDFFLPFSFVASCVFVIILALLGAYRFDSSDNWIDAVRRLFLGSFFWGMTLVSFYALVYRQSIFSRMMLIQAMVFVIFIAVCLHFFLTLLKKKLWEKGVGIQRVILLGSEQSREEFRPILQKQVQFRLAGEFLPDEIFSLAKVDEVWHIDRELPRRRELALRELCYRNHKTLRFVPASSMAFARLEMIILGGIPLIRPVPASLSGWGRIYKRLLDIMLAWLFIMFLAPLFAVLALGVKLSSRGPVFYGSKRVGRNGQLFTMWKFRSMISNADSLKASFSKQNHRSDGPFFKIKGDPRVTPFGKFLRRFSLDELPNFFNVLCGDMSIIGSRPHFPDEIKKIAPEFRRILAMRPGISGLSQVSGRSDLSFAREMELELYYLEHWSIWLDLKIFLKTIWVILRGSGAD